MIKGNDVVRGIIMLDKVGCNPWISMWTKPKDTIRKIVDVNPNYKLFTLSSIYGFVSLIGSSQSFSLGEKLNTFLILISCIILAPLWGYLIFSSASYFIFFTGKWFKGIAKYSQIRCAVAWSNVPMIVNLFIWLMLFMVFKGDILKDFPVNYAFSNFERVFLFIMMLAQLGISIWIIILYVNSLAEVQKFSVGKAILNLLIAIVIFAAIFFVITMLYFAIIKGITK